MNPFAIFQVRKTLNPSRYKDFTTAVALYKSTEKIDKLITDLDQIFPAENHELLAGKNAVTLSLLNIFVTYIVSFFRISKIFAASTQKNLRGTL